MKKLPKLSNKIPGEFHFIQNILDTLQDNVVIVDDTETIVLVNKNWINFGTRNDFSENWIGTSFLDFVGTSKLFSEADLSTICEGIQLLKVEKLELFEHDFSYKSDYEKGSICFKATPFNQNDKKWISIALINSTEQKQNEVSNDVLQSELLKPINAGAVGIEQDITEIKQANLKIKESEENFRNLIEHSQDAIVIVQDEDFEYANEAFVNIAGYTQKELIGKNYSDFVSDSEVQNVLKQFQRKNEGDYMDTVYETKIKNKQGVDITIEFSVVTTIYKNEIAILVIIKDITKRKLAEEQYKLFFTKNVSSVYWIEISTPIPIDIPINEQIKIIFDNAYVKDLSNEAAIFWKLPKEKREGIGLQEIFSVDEFLSDTSNLYQFYKKFIENGYSIESYESSFSLCNGETVSLLVNMTGVIENGCLTRYLGSQVNITDKKIAEEQVLNYQKRLKDLAMELTITEERERKKIAIDLHDHVGQLLVSSRMQLALLNKKMDIDELLLKTKSVSSGLLVSIQAIRAAIFDLSPPQLNEIGLIAAVSDWLEEEEITEKHGIKTILIGDEIELEDDTLRIILFRNIKELLVNVIKHSKASKLSVSIKKTNLNVVVNVKDNGIGFNYYPEMLRLKKTGFGLFSLNESISDIGGEMHINSIIGEGTTVKLVIPILIHST